MLAVLVSVLIVVLDSYRCQTLYPSKHRFHGSDDIGILKTALSDLQQLVTSQAMKMEILEKELKLSKEIIAFTAVLNYNTSISDLKKGQRIIFNGVITNLGNAYNDKTGTFHCPTTGLYGFYYNLHTLRDKYAMVALTKNGDGNYAYAFSGNHSSGESDGSTFVVLSLMKGDRIWLRANKDCSTGEVLKYQVNTFSGFLLHAY
ncbi:caprin-2-like [Saccostrea echinata]|uniref:caprin-2-like n=1 Tax=Saccostrea echinata TaxID=191078 RepID=UPI002A840309|nr:caprin-2-like [Saccostrea echinata]